MEIVFLIVFVFIIYFINKKMRKPQRIEINKYGKIYDCIDYIVINEYGKVANIAVIKEIDHKKCEVLVEEMTVSTLNSVNNEKIYLGTKIYDLDDILNNPRVKDKKILRQIGYKQGDDEFHDWRTLDEKIHEPQTAALLFVYLMQYWYKPEKYRS